MRLSENRTVAWIIYALVVLIAIGSSGNALHRDATALGEQALDAFYKGADGSGLCIDRDLKARVEDAYILIGIANGYPALSDAAAKATEAHGALDKANSLGRLEIAQRAAANKELSSAIEDLYTRMNNEGLSDQDARDASSCYDDFTSHGNTIARDPYNDLANDANGKIDKLYAAFPANLLSKLGGGKPALGLF